MRIFLLILFFTSASSALRVRGTFKPSRTPFVLVTKFGFQRTVSTADIDTRGYVFGNITANSFFPEGTSLTLSLLPSSYYNAFSNFARSASNDAACANAFEEIGKVAYDATCNPNGVEDFLRKVPCPKGKFCPDEDRPEFVVKDNQLTYIVEDFQHPRFWFLSIISCYWDASSCKWKFANASEAIEMKYDLWLVNGNPYKKHKNPLEYQFSFEKQDTAEMYLIFSAVYAVLAVVSWWNWHLVGRTVAHPAFVLFLSVGFLLAGLSFVSLDVCLFAVDGVGLAPLGDVARILRTFSQDLLVLLFVALASGWGLFYPDVIIRRKLVIGSWLAYAVTSLFVNMSKLIVEGQSEADADTISAWPDVLAVVLRSSMTFLFLRELRSAFSRPERPTLTHFPTPKQRETLLRFGAAGLVWFVGVPLAEVIISTNVDAFWRFKIALGLTYGVDAVAHSCVCHLLWAKRYADNYGFTGAVAISMSPSPFFLDSASKPAHPSSSSGSAFVGNGFKETVEPSRRRQRGNFVDDDDDGIESDGSDQAQRSLLRADSDDSEDGVELLNVTAMK